MWGGGPSAGSEACVWSLLRARHYRCVRQEHISAAKLRKHILALYHVKHAPSKQLNASMIMALPSNKCAVFAGLYCAVMHNQDCRLSADTFKTCLGVKAHSQCHHVGPEQPGWVLSQICRCWAYLYTHTHGHCVYKYDQYLDTQCPDKDRCNAAAADLLLRV